ncbi:MAG: DUF4091 domain-containing protein [Kiritimatiellae bacterium]|nr:DUF4091 domain-containing protein [Kiritimatiellia bacterium]MDD5522762.1 DUF4091 domain-containing protein [Kiritimatiellia bacterium]
MNSHKKLFFRTITRVLVLSVVMILSGSVSECAVVAPFEVFGVSDAVRVFEDGYGLSSNQTKEVRVFGICNEIISAQCVVRANEDIKDMTVVTGPLKLTDGSATLDANTVKWNYVENILIKTNTPKLVKSDLIRPAPARFPDLLSDQQQCSPAKGSLKAIYLTIRIPKDAKPGEYRGDVTVRSGDTSVAIPLVVTVYPLMLPDDRHVMVAEWFSTHQFKKHHGIDPSDTNAFEKMLAVYAENMADHRQNVFRASMGLIKTTRAADGKFNFDFSAFDHWADIFWSTGRMNLLETGFVAHFGEGGWSSHEVKLNNFSVKDESTGKTVRIDGKEFLSKFLPAFVTHLREKKWLDKTVFHISDEPSNSNVMDWREASDVVHQYAPELRRIDAIETTHCLDRLEVWVPKLDHLSTWLETYLAAQRRGNELWFYTVGIYQQGSTPNKTVDVPLIESRIMHWLNYRYGMKGYLHWGLNAWTDDPVDAPGQHRGDGWHVYPKKGGLLNSLRWEQMRNGLQDYECLWLLEKKIAAIKATLSPRVAEMIEPTRRGVEIALPVVRTCSDYTRDPEVLYAARQQAIEEAVGMDASPRMILQTNPFEHSVVGNNCSIDIHGWVEPGTTLTVNGGKTHVAEDGLFLVQRPPSREGTITVEAVNGQAKKTLVRKFRLQFESVSR